MVDAAPQFETIDNLGTTSQYSGTATTSPTSVPAIAGNAIAECLVRCASSNAVTKRLQVSFDGGTTYMTLSPGEFVGWSLKGGVTQIQLKTPASTTDYEIVLNREP